eukprot:3735651-Ditylum_brightwellii.AAC.1
MSCFSTSSCQCEESCRFFPENSSCSSLYISGLPPLMGYDWDSDLDDEEEDSCIADDSCSFYSKDNSDSSCVCSKNDAASIISRNLEDLSIDFDCSTGNTRSSDSDSDDTYDSGNYFPRNPDDAEYQAGLLLNDVCNTLKEKNVLQRRKRKRVSHTEEDKRRCYIGAIYDMLGRPAKEKWG